MSTFNDFYRGKTVLVTGHTGFKGSWLATWLTNLGAKVVGYAIEPPTEPSNFVASRLCDHVVHVHGDVRDAERLERTCRQHRPDVIFHLAAQALVRRSYERPRETFEVNVMGTVNVLEAAARTDSVQAVVSITSDKCYRNVEWVWGYRETDELGGEDSYSGSKAAAEMAIAVYRSASFQKAAAGGRDLAIASTRAGNVIGGGDWAADRLVPDLVRAIAAGRDLVVRNPRATRPWQHVLEPLSGYLWLGAQLGQRRELRSSWNFGPSDERPRTVEYIANGLLSKWAPPSTQLLVEPDERMYESTLLRLDCNKANHMLDWRSTLDTDGALEVIVNWYKHFYDADEPDMFAFGARQIEDYVEVARRRQARWALTD